MFEQPTPDWYSRDTPKKKKKTPKKKTKKKTARWSVDVPDYSWSRTWGKYSAHVERSPVVGDPSATLTLWGARRPPGTYPRNEAPSPLYFDALYGSVAEAKKDGGRFLGALKAAPLSGLTPSQAIDASYDRLYGEG